MCGGHVAKIHLLSAMALVLDSIGEEAFLADRAYIDQGAMHAGAQKFLAQTCQRWRVSSAEKVRRDCKIQLIDQAQFQQSAKKGWAAFTGDGADLVLIAQDFQHCGKVDLARAG